MFCPQCGRENQELFKGLCRFCFIAQSPLITLPSELEVEFCSNCTSTHVGNKWQELHLSEDDIIAKTVYGGCNQDIDAEDVTLTLEIINQKGSVQELMVMAKGKVLGQPLERECRIRVNIKRTVCPECSKFVSGYYEAVIQLRADQRPLKADEIQKADYIISQRLDKLVRKNRMAYLTQRAELKEGVDYYLGSYKAARKISSVLKDQMGGMIRESPRLMGRDKSTGKDLYRIWISLRLPIFEKEDFLAYGDHLGQIVDLKGNKIILRDLKTMKITSQSWREYTNLEKVANREDIHTTTVTSKTPTCIQVLHPENYQPRDLDIGPELSIVNIGDQVKVVEIRKKLYMLPSQEKKMGITNK
jgi:nonsense-mediated mRNA decay protein 3